MKNGGIVDLTAEEIELVGGGDPPNAAVPLQGAAVAITALTIFAGIVAAPAAAAFGCGALVAIGLGLALS